MVSFFILLFFVVVVASLAYWAIHRVGAAFGLPGPILALADVVIVVAAVIYILINIPGFPGFSR